MKRKNVYKNGNNEKNGRDGTQLSFNTLNIVSLLFHDRCELYSVMLSECVQQEKRTTCHSKLNKYFVDKL